MNKTLSLIFINILFVLNVFAEAVDSTISISSSKNNYQFVYNSKTGEVEIKQLLNTIYISNAYQVKLPVAEVYNNQVTINDVTCKIDNHTVHDLKLKNEYYSVDDIFFSDERICYFPLLIEKKGSLANVTFDETTSDPRYLTTVYFSEPYDIKRKELTFIIPKWMNVELKEVNFGASNITKTSTFDSKSNSDIITYTAQNIPGIKEEDNSPGPSYIYPHLMILSKSATVAGHEFRYFSTLADQYKWYLGLIKNINDDKGVIAKKANELTAGLINDSDKIKAVFYYVQDNIRYLAFEDGMAGFKPEKADEVLRKKFGDCKGMANLTKSLLTSLGYDARLCWLGTDHIAYDYQTPSLAVDNHMICCLYYKGKPIYLDATETNLDINEYAERIQGRQVLIENGDNYQLSKIPFAETKQNYDIETSKLSIKNNSLAGTVNRVWKGEDKEDVLNGLSNVKKEKTDDVMVHFLSNQNNDYIITNLNNPIQENHRDKDLAVSYNVDYKDAVSVFNKDYYLDLDFDKELLRAAIDVAKRKHDFWFSHKINITKKIELSIPVNYKVGTLPANLNIVKADYEFHINYTLVQGKLLYEKIILVKNPHLTVDKFSQWNNDVGSLVKTYNDNVVLKPLSE